MVHHGGLEEGQRRTRRVGSNPIAVNTTGCFLLIEWFVIDNEFTDHLDNLITEFVILLNSLGVVVYDISGLSLSQYRMLALLTTSSDGMRARHMAKMLNLAPSSMSVCMVKMRDRGFAEIMSDPRDRRASVVRITDSGTRSVYLADASVEDYVEDVWSNISYEQRKLTVWGSIMAVSQRGMARVRDGEIDVHAAYLEALWISAWASRNATRKHGLSLNEFRVLRCLANYDSGIRAGGLGIDLLLSSSAIAQITGSLEKRGLVRRKGDVSDMRAHLVSLTEAGGGLLRETIPDLLKTGKFEITPISRHDVREYERIAECVLDFERSRFFYD